MKSNTGEERNRIEPMVRKKSKRQQEFAQRNLDFTVELIQELMDSPQKLDELPAGAPIVPMPADADREHRAYNLSLAGEAVKQQGSVILAIQKKRGRAQSSRAKAPSAHLVALE